MARPRVYELARELNMTNKVLLEKLDDLDISVKSHMSALDDDVITKIKSSLFGTIKEEAIEEIRIQPTIIRRRRKKVQVEVSATPDAKPEDADDAAEVVEELEVEEPQEVSVAPAEEKPAVKEAKKPKKALKKEPSAKIIQLPVKPSKKPFKKKKAEPKKARAKVEEQPTGRKAAAARRPQEIDPAPIETKKRKHKKKKRFLPFNLS